MLGTSEKVTKDPDRYCKLQSHVPEQNTFIGKWFYLVSGPLFDEVKKQHKALKAPGAKTMMPKPSHFPCGSQLNRPPDSTALWSVPGKSLHILTQLLLPIHLLNPYILVWGYLASSPRRLKKLLKKLDRMSIKKILIKATG
ncbi:hypothetical protein VP01_779g7 [Puccinia sorghi]|uniref:Tet-like 2OG-Fe(II) oxygenase domain-containing protein n=1 Tax=Puccinia sorghi TaxID=27349 RepID=A0A0L6UDB9_9BASI|nr:hypothetical protein VP01_779g7 [Puccinia sorghi]